jgi:hypothetical protein
LEKVDRKNRRLETGESAKEDEEKDVRSHG